MFPSLGKTITTEQTQYLDLDETVLQALMPRTERGRVTVTEWNGRIWLLLPRYDGIQPMFLIAFSISPEALSAALERLSNDQTRDMALVREDGTVLAACGSGAELYRAGREDRDRLSAETGPVFGTLKLAGYTMIDEAMAPFVTYRIMLWALSALALILLAAYLLFYRRQILRPINQLVRSMKSVEQDTRYRIDSSGLSDYDDDLYVQFNHMIDHIEELAAQLYEEKYRVQKAELKQLQMQIDPHFLYNTLYMIYRIAQSEGNQSIARLSLNLSDYYRYITKMPEQIVPLRDEIRHVTNYLEIQRIRFEPRIRVEIGSLPEEIAGEMIPSLIIQHIVETGGITAKLKDSFPSETITQPDNFVSLLYYFGMLTIAGKGGVRGIKFRIPNQVVREQIYGYLTEAYRDNELSMDDWQRSLLLENMAIDGDWRPFFEYMSATLKRFASQRDLQKGEAFVHGFTLSQTCMSSFYLPISELDAGVKPRLPLDGQVAVGGYADIYLQPMLGIYPDIEHSYVLELKYLSSKATDAEVSAARETAIEQLTRYARSVAVERTIGHTQLHRLILVWRGMDLAVAEEL